MLQFLMSGALVALLFSYGCAFNAISMRPLRSANFHRLYMGGGRSPAEQGMSKRQMFRMVRDKVFEAAKLPGFFDIGEGPPVNEFINNDRLM